MVIMTKIDRPDVEDRITVMDDEKKRVIDLYDMRLVPPSVGVFDEPTRCYKVNKQWAKIFMGVISANLLGIAAWRDATDEGYSAILAVQEFLVGDNCGGDCPTLPELVAEPTGFAIYQPVVFGNYYSETIAHNTTLVNSYNGTPQSIGALIPAGVPTDEQSNPLCFAANQFVELYCSYKTCIIQSKSFVEVQWNRLQTALINSYNEAREHAIYNFLPDLYACFVSDAEAISVMADAAAIQNVACSIYDYLKTRAMSQANFDAAIANAVATLAGNAIKIACIMQNDNNLDVYLNFLEAYNIALQRQLGGEQLNCPCVTGSFQVYKVYFSQGMGSYYIPRLGNGYYSTLVGGRIRGEDVGSNKLALLAWDDVPTTYRFKAVKVNYERIGGASNGTYDYHAVRLRPNMNSTVSQVSLISAGFMPNGFLAPCNILAGATYTTGIRQVAIECSVADLAGANVYIDSVEFQFYAGFGRGYYTDDVNICV
jgi:hypothetical protein